MKQITSAKVGLTEMKIGAHEATLIEDRSTLQMGIGSIPDAVPAARTTTKTWVYTPKCNSDGIIDLMEKGVINNRWAKNSPQQVSNGLCPSARADSTIISTTTRLSTSWILTCGNDPHIIIRRNDKMVAINSAIESTSPARSVPIPLASTSIPVWVDKMDFMRGLR